MKFQLYKYLHIPNSLESSINGESFNKLTPNLDSCGIEEPFFYLKKIYDLLHFMFRVLERQLFLVQEDGLVRLVEA